MEQLARENDIEIPGNSAKDGKSGVYEVDEYSDSDGEEFFDEDQDDGINEVGDGGCGFCGANHETDDCIKVINYAIMSKVSKFTPAKLEDILTKSDPWQGKDCDRKGCLLCLNKSRTGKNTTQDCTRRSLVYETWCMTCHEKDVEAAKLEAERLETC